MMMRIESMALPAGPSGFFQWLRASYPPVYAKIKTERPDLLTRSAATLGQTAAAPSWVDGVMKFVNPLLQVYQHRQVVKVQLERAKRNLPPLPPAQLLPGRPPPPGQATQPAASIPWAIVLPAAGLALFFLFRPKKRGRA